MWPSSGQMVFAKEETFTYCSSVGVPSVCDAGFILETDASYVGLGAVLSQQQEDGDSPHRLCFKIHENPSLMCWVWYGLSVFYAISTRAFICCVATQIMPPVCPY